MKVKMITKVQGEGLTAKRYTMLVHILSGLYIGKNGYTVISSQDAMKFWGWPWQRISAARSFAKKHDHKIVRSGKL